MKKSKAIFLWLNCLFAYLLKHRPICHQSLFKKDAKKAAMIFEELLVLGLGTHLFVSVRRPVDSEVTFFGLRGQSATCYYQS